MKRIILALENQELALNYPESLEQHIRGLFANIQQTHGSPEREMIVYEDERLKRYDIDFDGTTKFRRLCKDDCLFALLGQVVEALITDVDSGVALHAGAVLHGNRGILLPGPSGAGKSSLTAWLADRGFRYATDECVILKPEVPCFNVLSRPLVTKNNSSASVRSLKKISKISIVSGHISIFWPRSALPSDQLRHCQLIVFPRFQSGAQLQIDTLTAAQATLALMACNVNARNLSDHGVGIITSFARRVSAITLHYGSFDQLEGLFDSALVAYCQKNIGSPWHS
jgi:hypothetical protein